MPADHAHNDPSERRREADRFLAEIERRAFYLALMATRHKEEALDIVQDAMLGWVRYLGHPYEAWRPLFFKVLQSRIRDWHRRTRVRRRVMSWFDRDPDKEDAEQAVAGVVTDIVSGHADGDPAGELANRRAMTRLAAALERLPLRQQQAFLLRSWEGLDVAQTAAAMGCSTGSVKTHLARAMSSLRASLGDVI